MTTTGDPEDPQFQRNLLYLLRLVPTPDGKTSDAEVELLRQVARGSSPAFLVKEAINNLGHILEVGKSDKVERALIFLLRGFERMLTKDEAVYTQDEAVTLLDRTVSVLARNGGPAAWAEVVDHGLSQDPHLGDPGTRLAELESQNLSQAPDVLRRLLDVFRDTLPKRGIPLAAKNEAFLLSLIRGLAGTPVPPVKELLKDAASRFSTRPVGQEADRVLAAFAAASRPSAGTSTNSLSGDLELFGLSTLVQNMADLKVTGTLTLLNQDGRTASILAFVDGRLAACQTGRLTGREAFFQLFERPFQGTFGLVRRPPGGDSPDAWETLPMVLEAIRRYDELERARALVPDDARFSASGVAATRPPDEGDEAFMSVLWDRMVRGFTPFRAERDIPVDSYRIRHLLEHWVQEGALRRI
jgi:hypothetical protein